MSIDSIEATIIASHVPVSLAEELRVVAAANDRSMSGEIRVAIRKHLADLRASQPQAERATERASR